MKAVGFDPGVHGGLAIVVQNADGVTKLVDAIDIPTIGTGAKERADVIAVQAWLARHGPQIAFIERAQAMPRQGASSGFKYGRATGALEATIALTAIPLELVEPSKWKKFFNLPGKDKEAARQRAIAMFPNYHGLLARKRDHGRAESALIAVFGLRTGLAGIATSAPLVPQSAESALS